MALLVLGDIDETCGEWADRDNLDLPGGQLKLLQEVAGLADKTVLVLVHGRPATFGANNTVLDKVDAIFAAWRPGEEGGTAITNLISGKTNPSGKLPVSWPRTVGHVHSGSSPWLQRVTGKWLANQKGMLDSTGRRYDNYVSSEFDPTPLFNFGFGLTYTKFEYQKLQVKPAEKDLATLREADGTVVTTATVTVKNTGHMAGTEVVQIYVEDPSGLPFVPYWRRLIGFTRVHLSPGETKATVVNIMWEDIAMHDTAMKMKIFQGSYSIFAGGSSNTTPLQALFVV